MLIRARAGKLTEELEAPCTYRDTARSLAIWSRGYFFDALGRLYCDGEVSEWLAGRLRSCALGELVPRMNGCFAVVVAGDNPARVTCATDRYGTVPVYCYLDGDRMVLSDDYWEVVRLTGQATFNRSAVLDMIRLGYVTGNETILEGILEIPWATIQTVQHNRTGWQTTKTRYWRLGFAGAGRENGEEILQQELADLLTQVMRRFVEGVESRGWDVAFALTGGVDSRLLVSLFKRLGCQCISAFSYGSSQDPDVVHAARIAQALDVPHRVFPVEDPGLITPGLVEEMTTRVGATTRFTCGLGPRLAQDKSPDASVFITGHTGLLNVSRDMLLARRQGQASRLILANHFILADGAILDKIWCGKDHGRRTADTIRRTLDFDPSDAVGSIQRWNVEQRQRRLILNELRTYEHLGRWMLPLWDHQLVDFLSSVPLQFVLRKRLYINTMVSHLFAGDLEAVGEIPRASLGCFDPVQLTPMERLGLMPGWTALRNLESLVVSVRKATRQRRTRYQYSSYPEGADPFDFWWRTSEQFRTRIVSMFEGWDGLGGMIDADALLDLLCDGRLPRYFLLFGIPSLLTLVFVQRIVQQVAGRSAGGRAR